MPNVGYSHLSGPVPPPPCGKDQAGCLKIQRCAILVVTRDKQTRAVLTRPSGSPNFAVSVAAAMEELKGGGAGAKS